MKEKIKSVIKRRIKPTCQYKIVNNKIVFKMEGISQFEYALIICGKEYRVKNDEVKIPLTEKFVRALMKKQYYIKVRAYSKEAVLEGKTINLKFEQELIQLERKQYHFKANGYAFVSIKREDNALKFKVQLKCIEDEKEDLTLVTLDKNCKIISTYLVVENKDILLDVEQLIIQEVKQFVLISKNSAYKIVSKGWNNNEIEIVNNFSRLYLRERKEVFSFGVKKITSTIPAIIPKYKYIDQVIYDNMRQIIVINEKKDAANYNKICIYLKNLKTNERIMIYSAAKAEKYVINGIMDLLNRKINQIDRYLFEFEILNSKEDVLEKNLLKIVRTKKRNMDDYVLLKQYGNHLTFLDGQILIIENERNHFTYEEKFDFSPNENTYYTNFNIFEDADGNVNLDLRIISLFSKIKKYTLFLVDSYSKHTFSLCERKLDIPSEKVAETIPIDMDVIEKNRYYNVRFNFRIGLEYLGGYKEYGLLVKDRDKYSTRDRYLYNYVSADEMVTSFYIGENLYNLNIWYTSKDEFEKGVSFQEGREKYTQTLLKEDVDKDLVIFEANLGKNYTGNPKYLYEYMINHQEYSSFKYVWAYPDVNSTVIPGNPTLVQRGTSEYFYYLGKAKYWINNILFPVKEKRKETVYLQTWHGTPLKKLGFDIECEGPEKQAFGNLYAESQNWDYFLADNDYGEEKLVNAFRFKKKVIKKGYPINDIFYDEDRLSKVTHRITKDYPAIKGKKVILYAPTWRDLQGDYVRGYDFALPFDLESLYKKYGQEYVIIVKLHHLISDSLVIDEKYKEFLINASNEEDIMELLCVTDILITDYSSVFYDFASARKPILFYMYDLEEYLNETRGLYVDISELPGPILKNNRELETALEQIQDYEYCNSPKLQKFCDDMAKYCHGESCKNVLDIVIGENKND